MLNGYSPRSLESVIKLKDIIKLKLGRNKADIRKNLANISYHLSDSVFDFNNIYIQRINGQKIFSTKSKEEYLALKVIDRALRRIYKIRFGDKSSICQCIIQSLTDESLHNITRLDFKSFFESVPRDKIIKKIISDSMLDPVLIDSLRKLNIKLSSKNYSGLPRGLSLSSTLAEIYLRDFDKHIKSDSNTYYYARYVDDIIVIAKSCIVKSEVSIKTEVLKLKLTLNEEKSIIIKKEDAIDFDYLGYNFKFLNKKILVSMSTRKKKKIKTRIIKSIIDYTNNNNSSILVKRIKFLTTNHHLEINKEMSELKSGIYYNNILINDFSCLSELDEFLRKSISSNSGSYSKKVKKIPLKVREEIFRMSFFNGYIKKEVSTFSNEDHLKIKACWKNE